jgi:putative transposase
MRRADTASREESPAVVRLLKIYHTPAGYTTRAGRQLRRLLGGKCSVAAPDACTVRACITEIRPESPRSLAGGSRGAEWPFRLACRGEAWSTLSLDDAHAEHTVHLVVDHHLIWCPTRRRRGLVGPLRTRLEQLVRAVATEHALNGHRIGHPPDQVHSAPPVRIRAHPHTLPSALPRIPRRITARSMPLPLPLPQQRQRQAFSASATENGALPVGQKAAAFCPPPVHRLSTAGTVSQETTMRTYPAQREAVADVRELKTRVQIRRSPTPEPARLCRAPCRAPCRAHCQESSRSINVLRPALDGGVRPDGGTGATSTKDFTAALPSAVKHQALRAAHAVWKRAGELGCIPLPRPPIGQGNKQHWRSAGDTLLLPLSRGGHVPPTGMRLCAVPPWLKQRARLACCGSTARAARGWPRVPSRGPGRTPRLSRASWGWTWG